MNYEELCEMLKKEESLRDFELEEILHSHKLPYEHLEGSTYWGQGVYIATLTYGHMIIPYNYCSVDDDVYAVIEKHGIKRLSESDVISRLEERYKKNLKIIKKLKETQKVRGLLGKEK